jgi:hypothetical protein
MMKSNVAQHDKERSQKVDELRLWTSATETWPALLEPERGNSPSSRAAKVLS